jgi:hypothetical protein
LIAIATPGVQKYFRVTIALLALHGPLARAQSSDSLDVLRHARHAQRDFEQFRRANLHTELDGGSHPCEERIGRFCYWYDPFSRRPPESEAIQRERARLLRELTDAGGRLPGDDWIVGQRVRYLVEHSRADLAIVLTKACRGTRWWCDALEGFARHAGRDYEGADHAFHRALSGMQANQRCTWTDLSRLLRGARLYRAVSCAERIAVEERIWWLAQPLYSRAGNDLRTEHYARQTMALLLEHAETPYRLGWGADMRELIVRFGWPTHWSRSFDRPASLEPPPVVGHDPSPSFWFFPTPAITEPRTDLTGIRWEPTMERPPARYSPPYATGFAPIMQVQFARFHRGDTTLTMAAFDLTSDSVFAKYPADVLLAVARDPATPVIVGRASPAGPLGVAVVRSGWRPAVLSLEAVGMKTGWVARRRVMAPPDSAGVTPVLSDILLFAPQDVLPTTLSEAGAAALRAPVVSPGQRVGLYWEMYRAADSTEPVQIAVTVTKARSKHDPLYPVGRPQCPPRVASPVTVRWDEEPGAPLRGAARSIALDLRRLSRGAYLIAIQVSVAGQSRGCSSRELRIVAR